MDSAIKKLINENPLIKFSYYTHAQAQVIRSLGREISGILDTSIIQRSNGTTHVEGMVFHEVWGKFWLWVIGAYEVVRTATQAKGCFTDELSGKFDLFKRKIAVLRIPFAKQEYAQGGCSPIQADASIAGVDGVNRDIRYIVKGTTFQARGLIVEFDYLISGITPDDVLQRHGFQHIKKS